MATDSVTREYGARRHRTRRPRNPRSPTWSRMQWKAPPLARARHVPVRRATHGDSRSVTEQPKMLLTLQPQVLRVRPPPLRAGVRGQLTAMRKLPSPTDL